MYLSRLVLNPRSRAVRNDLANCQGMHRTLLKAFPAKAGQETGARDEFGLLYRTEADHTASTIRIYVQSIEKPDWTRLPPGYLTEDCGMENPACKHVGAAYEKLPAGTFLSFALRANPTRKVGTTTKVERLSGKRNNGRRSFIAGTDEQIEWLKRKGEQGGYELVSVKIDTSVPDLDARPEPNEHGYKGRGDDRAELTFGAVLFHGRLRITDRGKFLTTLASGIGPGKAYGFGLLSIAPPR